MQIRRDTWHYKVWAFTFEGKVPEKTSLCRYVWRILLLPVPKGIIGFGGLLCLFAILVAVWALGNLWGIASGGNFIVPTRDDPFTKKPIKDFNIGGRSIKPRYVAAVVWAGVAAWFFGPLLLAGSPTITSEIAQALLIIGPVAGIIIALFVLYLIGAAIISAIRRWEGWDIAKAYLKAKKEGVCPLVTFE